MERKKLSNNNFNVPTACTFCFAKCITAVGNKLIVLLIIFFLSASPVFAAVNQPIIIDQEDVGTFSTLSDADIARAAALKMLIRHASVGANIKTGLNQLLAQNRKYQWSNWVFQSRGNPGWQPKIDDLVTQVNSQASNYGILTMKFCYVDNNANWDYYRTQMETLQAAYPSKMFIWWTIPLTTTGELNQVKRNQFNSALRTYAQTHNIILFDIAAIESHDPGGNLYRTTFQSYSMDSLFPDYSSDGGHLSSLGSERMAKAFWVMMATIAGSGSVHPTLSPSPSSVSKPGDFNGDGSVDIYDFNLVVSDFGNPYTIFDYNTVVAQYGK